MLDTDWCRTESKVPPTGIAVPFGRCRNVMSSLIIETRHQEVPITIVNAEMRRRDSIKI